MFIIVPVIIIFLCGAYLYLNKTTFLIKIIIYSIIILIFLGTILLYKFIKKDLKQQEKNEIQLQINQLLKALENEQDKRIINSTLNKINKLKKFI